MLFSDLVKLAMIALHVTASETNCRRLVQWSLWGYTVLGLLKIANHVDYLLGSGFFFCPNLYAVEVEVPPFSAKFYEASFRLLVAVCTILSYPTYYVLPSFNSRNY